MLNLVTPVGRMAVRALESETFYLRARLRLAAAHSACLAGRSGEPQRDDRLNAIWLLVVILDAARQYSTEGAPRRLGEGS